jgi:hypothetical protein
MLFRMFAGYITLCRMKVPGAFELEVLGWVAEDYEAPHTIAGDIAREIGRPVSEAEVRCALLDLTERGLVQAYAFEPGSGRYRSVTSAEARTIPEPWFMATQSPSEGEHAT